MLDVLEHRYPPTTAEGWDRVGLAVGDRAQSVTSVLLTVDVTPQVLAEAVGLDAQLVVAHHPLLLRGITAVDAAEPKGRLVIEAVRAGVSVYTAHTNADIAVDGVSASLAETVGLVDTRPLVPSAHDPAVGAGRVGRLAEPLTAGGWLERVAAALPATAAGVRLAGDPDRLVRTAAVVGGAGDSYLDGALAAGVDAYLTSDLRHHPVSELLQRDDAPLLLDVPHAAAEATWLPVVQRVLRDGLPDLDVTVSGVRTDPWTRHAASPTANPHTTR
ncbi:Nif3-like dinuclear metal center hexameric protein [Desertihabitans brevis]|uniref:GTP cyclohydrolase 1 type 2 homolog n=1 Tax=Desertihabitans brevis TaxID=2268447 RepID=A0A367YTN2_9ACTN|nr:Nif3-like dinuclear metal center hexameric protein [Desertihabitans brevis]